MQDAPREADSAFVFGGRRGLAGFSYYNKELGTCLAASGDVTEDWTLHDIRRTVRSELGELGVEPWIAETILAHKRAGIEATYNQAKLERQMRAALTLWAERLRAIVEDTESNVVTLRMTEVCRIKGCDAKPVAKGLCPKHYMRKRRQGTARKVGKPGRPRSPLLEMLRQILRGDNPRTLARTARLYRSWPKYAGLSDQAIVDRYHEEMRVIRKELRKENAAFRAAARAHT
jgi:hypothetical protein